jgi:hypothetical protein
MSNNIKVKGIPGAKKALKRALNEIENVTEEMLVVMMQAISANTMPYVPVDTSALINSEYRRSGEGAKGPWAVIGYGGASELSAGGGTPVSEYAAIVHDGPQKNWQKPGASNKFLVKGLKDFIQDDLSRIISAYQP